MKKLYLIFIVGFFICASSYAGNKKNYRPSLIFLTSYHTPNKIFVGENANPISGDGIGSLGVGFLLDIRGRKNPFFGFETGGIRSQFRFDDMLLRWQIPLLLRFNVGLFSAGVGLEYEYGSNYPSEIDHSTFGYLLSARFDFGGGDRWSFFFDGRYREDLDNRFEGSTSDSLRFSEFYFILGVKIFPKERNIVIH